MFPNTDSLPKYCKGTVWFKTKGTKIQCHFSRPARHTTRSESKCCGSLVEPCSSRRMQAEGKHKALQAKADANASMHCKNHSLRFDPFSIITKCNQRRQPKGNKSTEAQLKNYCCSCKIWVNPASDLINLRLLYHWYHCLHVWVSMNDIIWIKNQAMNKQPETRFLSWNGNSSHSARSRDKAMANSNKSPLHVFPFRIQSKEGLLRRGGAWSITSIKTCSSSLETTDFQKLWKTLLSDDPRSWRASSESLA